MTPRSSASATSSGSARRSSSDFVTGRRPMYYTEAIGLGLVISLIFFEEVGLAAGGMVVPGYIALNLDDPWRIAGTLLVALVTFALVRFFAAFTFIYGRRRIVVTILIAFILGTLLRQ